MGPRRTTMSKSLQVRLGQVREFLGDGLNLPERAFRTYLRPPRIAKNKTKHEMIGERGRR